MIDREKVIKALECCDSSVFDCEHCSYGNPLSSMDECHDKLLRDACELLKEQKHGYWVFDPNGMDWNLSAWKCSKCHCRNDNIPPNLEKTNPLRWAGSKFCPNCGAKMDEEVKQNG